MTTLSKKQKAAIQSREVNKELLSRRRAGGLALPLPTFDSLNENGLILEIDARKPLPVTFDISELAEEEDLDPATTRLDIHMRGKGSTNWGAAMYSVQFQTPTFPDRQPIDEPFIRDIPVSRLTEGQHEIGYILHEGASPTPLMVGAPLEVDRTEPLRPNYPPAPSFPGYLTDEITEQHIEDNPDGLVCTFPDAPGGAELGVSIAVYFSPDFSSQLSEPIDTYPITAALSFTVPWALITGNRAGLNYLFYQLIDLAGNISKDSAPARVKLNLTAEPDPLEAYVPLALLPDDGLLDLEDLYEPTGVYIAIREYANNLPMIDVIELTLGSQPPQRFAVNFYLPFPLMLPVSRATLLAHYGTSTGELDTSIDYFIDRNGSPFDAPTHDIKIDFSAPGPTPGTDPENPLLNPVLVYGSDPDAENQLTEDDFEKEATVKIVLWDTPIPAPGTVLRGYWGSFEYAFDVVPITTEGPGDTVSMSVPWSIIRAVGNGIVNVFYTLEWATNDNIQRSAPQPVVVNANKVVLEPATFSKATAFWSCTDLNRTTFAGTVRVPGNMTYFREFMVIRCEVRVFSDITGDSQLGETTTIHSPPLTPDMVANGFTITVPYAVIRPAVRNSADFHYFVPIPGEGEQPSVRAWTRTRFTDLNGVFCENQPPTTQEDGVA